MSEVLLEYGNLAFNEVKKELGDKWDELTPKQKLSLERCSRRIIELELRGREGLDVADDLAFVKATLQDFKLAGEIAVADLFWQGLNRALEALGTFLGGSARAIILGA